MSGADLSNKKDTCAHVYAYFRLLTEETNLLINSLIHKTHFFVVRESHGCMMLLLTQEEHDISMLLKRVNQNTKSESESIKCAHWN